MDCCRLRELLAAAEINTKTAIDLVQAGASATRVTDCLALTSGHLAQAKQMIDQLENASAAVNGTAKDNVDMHDPVDERGKIINNSNV